MINVQKTTTKVAHRSAISNHVDHLGMGSCVVATVIGPIAHNTFSDRSARSGLLLSVISFSLSVMCKTLR